MLSVLAAAPASAAPQSTLTIHSTTVLDASTCHLGPGNGTAECVLTGTFTASGAISDSGSEQAEIMFAAFGRAPDLESNHAIHTFTGSEGSITVRMQALHDPAEIPVIDGSWTIVAATGAYAGLHGTGTVVFSVTGEGTPTALVDETWTGSVQ